MNKHWYLSKTLWVNAIAIGASFFAPEQVTPAMQIQILGVINLILRIITKNSLGW